MNGYEEKIKDCLFLEVCNAAGREEWGGLAHQQKENLMLVCRLSGHDETMTRISFRWRKNRRESGGRMPTFMSLPTTWIMGRCT